MMSTIMLIKTEKSLELLERMVAPTRLPMLLRSRVRTSLVQSLVPIIIHSMMMMSMTIILIAFIMDHWLGTLRLSPQGRTLLILLPLLLQLPP